MNIKFILALVLCSVTNIKASESNTTNLKPLKRSFSAPAILPTSAIIQDSEKTISEKTITVHIYTGIKANREHEIGVYTKAAPKDTIALIISQYKRMIDPRMSLPLSSLYCSLPGANVQLHESNTIGELLKQANASRIDKKNILAIDLHHN